MTFAGSNIVCSLTGADGDTRANWCAWTAPVDIVLIISAIAVGVIMFSGESFGLSMESGAAGSNLAISLESAAGFVFLADALTLYALYKLYESERKQLALTDPLLEESTASPAIPLEEPANPLQDRAATKAYILANQTPASRNQLAEQTLEGAQHRILGGLYLGNAKAFSEAACLEYTVEDWTKPIREINVKQQGLNSLKFTSIISLCMGNDIGLTRTPNANHPDTQKMRTKLSDSGIDWHHPGKGLSDDPSYWGVLVHDCTLTEEDQYEHCWFVEGELLKRNTPEYEAQKEQIAAEKAIREQQRDAMCALKAEKYKKIPVVDWFEPMFKEIDKALSENKLTLVHCHAGSSRSATLLAAYLIKRFDVTAEEAINFLRNRREVVSPKFVQQLKDYEVALRAARPPV